MWVVMQILARSGKKGHLMVRSCMTIYMDTFLSAVLEHKILEVIMAHTLSKLKMVYMNICNTVGLHPSVQFFKTSAKDRKRLYDLIWDHQSMLQKQDNWYVLLFTDICIVNENLHCVEFSPHSILTITEQCQ